MLRHITRDHFHSRDPKFQFLHTLCLNHQQSRPFATTKWFAKKNYAGGPSQGSDSNNINKFQGQGKNLKFQNNKFGKLNNNNTYQKKTFRAIRRGTTSNEGFFSHHHDVNDSAGFENDYDGFHNSKKTENFENRFFGHKNNFQKKFGNKPGGGGE